MLKGINRNWGQYRGIFAANRNLVAPEAFDAGSGRILYSVPATFGQERQIGTNLLLQFQAQIWARYSF